MRTVRTVRRAAAAMATVVFLTGCATVGPVPVDRARGRGEGEITHLPTRERVTFAQMMDVVGAARLVCLGETHNSVKSHAVQVQVVRELVRRHPGRVALGMEMFREPQQAALDRWTRGELTETEFRKESDWAGNWGFGYGLYRELLNLARDERLDIVALNPSKELQRAVSMTGLGRLTPEVRARLPEIGPPDDLQREVLKALFGAHFERLNPAGEAPDPLLLDPDARPPFDAPPPKPAPTFDEEKFDAFYRVQMLWEESMAGKVADYLRSPRGEGRIMVTVTGGWHVQYAFGIPKKVFRRLPLPYVVVIPEEITLPEGKEQESTMQVELPVVPLPPADFTWTVNYELPEEGQRLGVQISEKDGSVSIVGVGPETPAEKAGLARGDVFVSLDGQKITRQADLFFILDVKRPGDKVEVVVQRGGKELPFTVSFPEKKLETKKDTKPTK